MSHDDLIQNPSSLTQQLISRAQHLGARQKLPSFKHLTALAEVAQHRLSPHLEDLVTWLTSEEHIGTLQSTLSKVANTAIAMGFQLDPTAALLFEFASWLEEEHGRDVVLPRILAHSPLEDGSLLNLLRRALTSPPDASPESRDADVVRVRRHMLLMLCSLAQLDEETPLPPHDDARSLHDYLARAILPPQFDLLADLALGKPEAFEAIAARHRASKQDVTHASTRDKIKHALLEKITPSPEPQHKEEGRATALSKGHARSPALTFLTTSYLLFIQTTLTRSMLETFPDMIAALKHAEQEERASHAAADAIEITPHDPKPHSKT